MECNQPYKVQYVKPTDSNSEVSLTEPSNKIIKAFCLRLPLKLFKDITTTSNDSQHTVSIHVSKDEKNDYHTRSLELSGINKNILKLSNVAQSSKTVSTV